MIVQSYTKPDRYVACPACGKGEWIVSHLAHFAANRQVGPWYCGHCGAGWLVQLVDEHTVNLEPHRDRVVKTKVTLRVEAPFTVEVEGMHFVKADGSRLDDDHEGSDRYFYEEHTCPTNWLPRVDRIIAENGDDDPHGLFKWVKTEVPAAAEPSP